jgi:stage II sporulation protein AA (anti-sigma F factor antagonist)
LVATELTHMQNDLPGRLGIVISRQGTTTTIGLEGEWDLAHQRATREAIHDALDDQPENVVLDLSRLSFIDSSGLHVTMELQKRSTRQNIHLVIVPGPRAVQRLFEVCQLTETLPFLRAS